MKSMKRTAVVLAMAVVMAVVIGSAEAGDKKFNFKVSGTFFSVPIDTFPPGAPDGQTAVVVTTEGKSTAGHIGVESLIEADFSELLDPSPCPDGQFGFAIVEQSDVYREMSTGDLLFAKLSPATGTFCFVCFEPGCTFFFTVDSDIVGGTGKYAGASGSININGTATLLAIDQLGNNFGGSTAEGTGVIMK